jgi:PIN like domain
LPRRDHVRYFADENAIGLAKVLLRSHSRDDIVHPGHTLLPEIPRGCDDLDWMPIIGRMGWIVLTRDRRIRTRPAELLAYREHGLCSVWIGGRQDYAPAELAALFIEHEPRLDRWATKLGTGPWALAMTQSGLSPIRLRGAD